jgi:hypothetical protein
LRHGVAGLWRRILARQAQLLLALALPYDRLGYELPKTQLSRKFRSASLSGLSLGSIDLLVERQIGRDLLRLTVLASLTNALKAPVLRLLIEVIEHSDYGINANRLRKFAPSVH